MRKSKTGSCGQVSLRDLATKRDIKELLEIMAENQTELTEQLKKQAAQITKIRAEQTKRFDVLTEKVAELQEIIDAGGTIGTDLIDAANSVQSALDAFDAEIPDESPA